MLSIFDNFGEQYNSQLIPLSEQIVQILNFFGLRRVYGVGGDFVANLIKGSILVGHSLKSDLHVSELSVCFLVHKSSSILFLWLVWV